MTALELLAVLLASLALLVAALLFVAATAVVPLALALAKAALLARAVRALMRRFGDAPEKAEGSGDGRDPSANATMEKGREQR